MRNAARASENDAVLFCGSGATGGIQLLISAMDLDQPPVVFIGLLENINDDNSLFTPLRFWFWTQL